MISITENNSTTQSTALDRDNFTALRTLSREDLHKLQDWLSAELYEVSSTLVPRKAQPELETLTPRENEVLTLIASGYTRREAALALSISECTAASHVKNIYRKLDIGSIAEATFFAVRAGMVG